MVRLATKECVFIISTIGIALLLALIVAELALRAPALAPTGAVKNPLLGFAGEPGGEHDARGFRNPSALDRADIVILGDSQTYGNNASRHDAWPAALSRITGQSVYQLAYGGFSAAQYEALLDDALALEPERLLIALYTGNDLLEVVERVYANDRWNEYRIPHFTPSKAMEESQDLRLAIESGTDPNSFGRFFYESRLWMRSNSRVYALIGHATRDARVALRLVENDTEWSARIGTFVASRSDIGYIFPDSGIPTLLSPAYRFNTVDLDQPDAAEGWRLTQALLLDIQSRMPEGVRLTLVIIPTKELAYLELLKKRAEPAPPGFEAYEAAERRLWGKYRWFCAHEGFECVFTLDALTNTLAERTAAYGDDANGHPKAAGYRAIAEAVAAGISH